MNGENIERRFDKLRFKVYSRFCDKCPRIFKTKSKNAYMCKKCSPKRSSEMSTRDVKKAMKYY